MKVWWQGFADAVGFLTVLPAGRRRGLGTPWFPLVGLLVGVAVAGPLLLPLPHVARATLALWVWTVVTGGLHEDGWADCMDAALAPAAPEERAAILKDPRVGAHGLTATVLLLMARFAGLATVPVTGVVAAPLVGRWVMVLAPGRFPPRRGGGLGSRFAAEARAGAASLWAVLGLFAVWLSGVGGGAALGRLAVAVLAGLAAGGALAAFLARRLGGLNGDGYGAVGVAAELAALWAFVPWGGP